MNLLLLEAGETGERVAIGGRRAQHARAVLRAEVGQRLRVGRIGDGVGHGTVVECTGDRLVLGDIETVPQAATTGVSIAVAMPRPKSLSRVLQSAACMGVDEVVLFRAWKVDKSYLDSPRLDPERVAEDFRAGLEQGGHVRLPRLKVFCLFTEFTAGLAGRAEVARLVCHPRAEHGLTKADGTAPTLLCFGPDGGFTERELETLEAADFRPVRLTSSVLRTDVAVVAALAQLELVRR